MKERHDEGMTTQRQTLAKERWRRFRANRRGYLSLWIFLGIFIVCLFAEFIANDRPLLVVYEGRPYFPVARLYSEKTFGGDFDTPADYRDPAVTGFIEEKGFIVWPPIRFSYSTINYDLPTPAPSAPTKENLLGTDDQGRDVLATIIYGFRISVLFGLVLTILSSAIGITAGALQGYYGGKVDIIGQRFIEVWSGMPTLFILIILSSVVQPNFWWLLLITLLFGWMSLVGVVRAEFLRTRNFEYVLAARALGTARLEDYFPAHAAERPRRDAHIFAVHPVRLDYDPYLARLSRLRPSAGLALARQPPIAGKGQPAGALARHLGFRRARGYLESPRIHRRGGARCARPEAWHKRSFRTLCQRSFEEKRMNENEKGNTNDVVLSISELRIAFRRGSELREVVHGINLEIRRNETLALVGESGSGKTVTAQSVLKLLPDSLVEYPAGKIEFLARDSLNEEPCDMLAIEDAKLRAIRGKEIGMVFQEPMSSLNPLHTVEQQLGETLFLHRGLKSAAARPVILDWLMRVGLSNPEKKLGSYPHQLSGGERQRVMIAMALANEPSLLIADEPTTALDVTIQAQILELLKELQRELGMSILFITHDLEIVRRIADRVAVMHDGFIVESGTKQEIFSNPAHPYTKKLIDAEPHGISPAGDPSRAVLLEAKNMKVWFKTERGILRKTIGHVKAVDGVNISLRKGETLGIAGESGSGENDTWQGAAQAHVERRRNHARRNEDRCPRCEKIARKAARNADYFSGSVRKPQSEDDY